MLATWMYYLYYNRIQAMKPSVAFQMHRDAIRRIVERHRASNVRVLAEAVQG